MPYAHLELAAPGNLAMARFDYPYKKGVNITAWVLQILVCLILLAASAWLLNLVNSDDFDGSLGEYEGLVTAASGLQIGITALTIIFDIVEIVLITGKRMPPALYLSSACIKTGIWGAIFIMNLISLSILAICLTLVLFGTSLMQLIYGAILIHRKRRGTLTGGDYALSINPDTFTAPLGAPPPGYYYQNPNVNTEYKPPTAVASPPPPQNLYSAPEVTGQPAPAGTYEMDNRQRFA
ncbi:hypothetical protein GGS23DRAFT_595419 [Durotheca rogersii]|uniref:uncharacterized protein n=1 Tax=Durotheca rogersii TaxID=419775 RepID=UPI00221F22C0|nr:uncharacterized protein GGS23DRAFT_595419 [Durotheca rogersii]KAI5864709.1 hypothetical protein GGS23DRAFT_595419 [Durotheca rogersii]